MSVAPAAVLVGEATTFTVVVTNQGPARATGLVVQDLLPAGLSFVSASPSQGSYAEATGAWTIGTLLNGAVGDADARGDRDRGRRHHQPGAGRGAGPARPRGAQQRGRGDRQRHRQRRRRRAVTAVDTPAPLVGETVTFTVTVANRGPSPATGVVVTDALPAGLTLVSATPSQGTYAAPIWTVGIAERDRAAPRPR